jgi:hypothetical protein
MLSKIDYYNVLRQKVVVKFREIFSNTIKPVYSMKCEFTEDSLHCRIKRFFPKKYITELTK